MRLLPLWLNRPDNLAVQGLNAANPLAQFIAVQNEVLEIVVHSVEKNPATPANPVFIERVTDYSAMRASLGLVDAAPETGTFKLRVVDQTTPALTWPADLSTPALVATWKASVLAALQALSNVGTGNVLRLDDPPNTPAHIFYLTWVNESRTDLIQVVDNRLTPLINGTSRGSLTNVGFTQILKLEQFPILATSTFTRPSPPSVALTETNPGGTGTNEEQTLSIPSAASGSFSLSWSGASTKTMAVASVTAASLAAALNAIVPDGDTNPSFAVESRATTDGKRFAIQFVGPLAGAARAMLGHAMHDQAAWPYATGELDLRGLLAIEQALNGQPSAALTLELVIDENEYYLIPLKILNAMTDPSTLDALETSGGVIRVEVPIYIDRTSAEPFAEIAPGYTFTPAAPGDSLVIAHGLNTWRPGYRVTQYEVDHDIFAADPTDLEAATTGSHEVRHVVITEHATTKNQFALALPFTLVSDPTSDLDYRLLKVDVWSPDATIKLWLAQILWDNVVQTDGGTTLTAKLAAIDAALGVFSGSLKIDAANITGLIKSTQLDLTSVATAIVNQGSFATSFLSLLTTNANVVNTIATKLGDSNTFATALTNLFASNTSLVSSLSTQLTSSSTFISSLRDVVLEIIQGGGNLPDGSTLMIVEDVILAIPPPQEIAGPSINRLVPATVSTTVTSGGTTSQVQKVEQTLESDPTRITIYPALAPAVPTYASGGSVSGKLAPGLNNKVFTVVGSASSRSIRGRRGQAFVDGAKLTCFNGFWYEVVIIDGVLYPKEYERELPPILVDATEFYPGSRFACTWPLFLKLAGNALGRIEMLAEIGTYSGDLSFVAWSTIFTSVVHLSPVNKSRTFGLQIDRASGGALTGTYKIQGQPHAFTPPSANFAVRLRPTKFDVEDTTADPRGSLSLTMRGATASIVSLT